MGLTANLTIELRPVIGKTTGLFRPEPRPLPCNWSRIWARTRVRESREKWGKNPRKCGKSKGKPREDGSNQGILNTKHRKQRMVHTGWKDRDSTNMGTMSGNKTYKTYHKIGISWVIHQQTQPEITWNNHNGELFQKSARVESLTSHDMASSWLLGVFLRFRPLTPIP